MKKLLTLVSVILLFSSCQKDKSNEKISNWTIAGDKTYFGDSVTRPTGPSDVYDYEKVISVGDTMRLLLEFPLRSTDGTFQLVFYPDYLENFFHGSKDFHLRLRHKGSFYRNYKSPITCGRLRTIDTFGIGRPIRLFDFGTVKLQRESNIADEIEVSGMVELAQSQLLSPYIKIGTDKYAFTKTNASSKIPYRVIFADKSGNSLFITFGSKPLAGKTFIAGNDIISDTNSVMIFVIRSRDQSSHLTPDSTSVRLMVTEDGSGLKTVIANLELTGNGGRINLTHADLYFPKAR